jgi:hypothetical protein
MHSSRLLASICCVLETFNIINMSLSKFTSSQPEGNLDCQGDFWSHRLTCLNSTHLLWPWLLGLLDSSKNHDVGDNCQWRHCGTDAHPSPLIGCSSYWLAHERECEGHSSEWAHLVYFFFTVSLTILLSRSVKGWRGSKYFGVSPRPSIPPSLVLDSDKADLSDIINSFRLYSIIIIYACI